MLTHNKKSRFPLFELRNFLVLLCLTTLAFSCKKSTGPDSGPTPSLTSFSFLKSVNSQIPIDAAATINGSHVRIFLPPRTNMSGLIATFTVAGSATVTVNGVTQQSGVTKNDFSTPITYTVTTPGGGSQTYTMTLTTNITA